VALKLAAPVRAPSIVARVGEIRLPARPGASCWPGRNGKIDCHDGKGGGQKGVATVPRHGTFRVVVAYPLQPKDGYIQVFRVGHVMFRKPWRENTHYDLPRGRYTLLVLAEYPKQVHVQYWFDFRVR